MAGSGFGGAESGRVVAGGAHLEGIIQPKSVVDMRDAGQNVGGSCNDKVGPVSAPSARAFIWRELHGKLTRSSSNARISREVDIQKR